MKLNPAFKRTQPLPLLTADLAKRAAGRAARGIAQVLPLAGGWPSVAAGAAAGVVKANYHLPVVGLVG